MRRALSLILASMLLLACSGCIWWDHDRGGYDERDHRGYDDRDRGGHDREGHDERGGHDEHH